MLNCDNSIHTEEYYKTINFSNVNIRSDKCQFKFLTLRQDLDSKIELGDYHDDQILFIPSCDHILICVCLTYSVPIYILLAIYSNFSYSVEISPNPDIISSIPPDRTYSASLLVYVWRVLPQILTLQREDGNNMY